MPPPPPSPPPPTESKRYNVLVTGYGPFGDVIQNPSWGCLQPLHNTTLHTAFSKRQIHITAFGPIRVTYAAVLAIVPNIHSVPPSFPPLEEVLHERTSLEPDVALPTDGFDVVLHLGAGRNGAVSVEKLGHGRGYTLAKDVDGKWPPVAKVGEGAQEQAGKQQEREKPISEADKFERERMGQAALPGADADLGYGQGYECFPENLETEVDVSGLIAHLNRLEEKRIQRSTDAGHFLCDYICYGSLAESQRPLFDPSLSPEQKNRKRAKTLFMHVPYDIGQPFSMDELVRIVKEVVCWVCTGEGEGPAKGKP